MTYYEVTTCRLAIQVCIGYSPNGRARHRTFSMRGLRPDAPDEAIAEILRALAPILLYPITKVRKVTKRTIFFNENAAPSAPPVVLPVPVPVPAEPEIPVWEDREEERAWEEQEKLVLALFVYMLMYRLLPGAIKKAAPLYAAPHK